MARSRSLAKFSAYGMRRKGKFEEAKHRRVKGRFADKPDTLPAPPPRLRLGGRMRHITDERAVARQREAVMEAVAPEPLPDPFADPDFRTLVNEADEHLPGEAQRAITAFVGHDPGTVDRIRGSDDPMAGFGIMAAGPLEAAIANDTAVAGDLGDAFDPIKAVLRARSGDTIRLYRYQRPISEVGDERAVLSWTSNPRFAKAAAGARPLRDLYTQDDIARFEAEYEANGVVRIGRQELRREEGNRTPMIYDERVGGMVTDTDSVRAYVEDVNEERAEANARNARRNAKVIAADIPLADVVWATDRAGQSEFIVRNRGAHHIGADGRPAPIAPEPLVVSEADRLRLQVRQARAMRDADMIARMAPPTKQATVAEIKLADSKATRKAWTDTFGDMTPQQFADAMVADMPKGVTVSMLVNHAEAPLPSDPHHLHVRMVFERNGSFIADAQRIFSPRSDGNGMQVLHASFHVDKGEQSKGLGKRFLKNSVAIYKQAGITRIETDANIDVGGYAWAKYGFRYNASVGGGRNFRLDAYERLDGVKAQLPKDVAEHVQALIGAVDRPGNIWRLADMQHPVIVDKGRSTERRTTLGKALLLHTEWPARLDLDDEQAMARFDSYVNKGGEGGEQAQDTVADLPPWAIRGVRLSPNAEARRVYAVLTSESRQSDADFLQFADQYAEQNDLLRDTAVTRLFPGWCVASPAERRRALKTGWYS